MTMCGRSLPDPLSFVSFDSIGHLDLEFVFAEPRILCSHLFECLLLRIFNIFIVPLLRIIKQWALSRATATGALVEVGVAIFGDIL